MQENNVNKVCRCGCGSGGRVVIQGDGGLTSAMQLHPHQRVNACVLTVTASRKEGAPCKVATATSVRMGKWLFVV